MKIGSEKLPKGFVLAKPIAQESYDESVIYELEPQGKLIITRKRDGWKLLAHFNSKGKIHLYTDGINEIDSRLDHIKKELQGMEFPPNTLVVGEAIVDLSNNDDLGKVIGIFHSKLDKSLAIQKEYGKVRFMVFAVISLTVENSSGSSLGHDYRFEINKKKYKYVFNAPIILETFNRAKELVVINGWEGLVLYDTDYQLTYRTDGKAPQRPEGCYKWKPILEDDFIVRHWIPRSDVVNQVKELILLQLDSETQQEFYCGKLGSFSNDMRDQLAKMHYPLVVQARFDMRFPKTGKIRNPRFIRIRDDKPVHACISYKNYPEAEYKQKPS